MFIRILNLLDKLAGWYFDWRSYTNASASQSDLQIESIEYNKQHGLEMLATSPGLVILADQCADLLDKYNAKNYIQFDMFPRPDRGQRPIRVTVAWASGQPPSERAAHLEKLNTQLQNQLAQMRAHTLEEAAHLVEQMTVPSHSYCSEEHAAAIRALIPNTD